MSRYIDFDYVKSKKRLDLKSMHHSVWMQDIYSAPSIDLVRCAECKNCKRKHGTFKGEPIIFYRCAEHSRDVESDDYCSWGERSE